MKNLNLIKEELSQFYGGGQLYRGMIKRSLYSEGVKHLLEEAKAYWMYDIIQTEVFDKLRKQNQLDTFYFKMKAEKGKAVLSLVNYKNELLWSKEIGFTTFPDGEIELVCGWDGSQMITCLHNEN